jgi:radical SAM protein with 4Fe4S-binding SPASM domain
MIKTVQLDPFGVCNAQCWYCPTRYYDPPEKTKVHMDPNLLYRILSELYLGKNDFVDPKFDLIYTGHYNEVILYEHFETMLDLFRIFNYKTIILSNGIAFSQRIVDTIKNYPDVVVGINFNCPSFKESEWAVDTNCSINLHPYANIVRAYHTFGDLVSVGVNGIDHYETHSRVAYGRHLIPGLNIYPVVGLCDRAGLLKKHCISNEPQIEKQKGDYSKVIGCTNGNRFDWLHINSLGETFICCQDYFYNYVFGDLKKDYLDIIWKSEERQAIKRKAKKTICKKCAYAVWGD